MLSQRIAAWDPTVHRALPEQAGGLLVRSPVALGCSGAPSVSVDSKASAEARATRLRDIEMRQLMAVRRREHEANAELRSLEAGLESLTAHQHEAIRELQRHGYLTHRSTTSTSPSSTTE